MFLKKGSESLVRYLEGPGRPEKLDQRQIKMSNMRKIFHHIRTGRQVSRAVLVRETRMSPTTVAMIVDELIENDLIMELGTTPTGTSGRRPIVLTINGDGRQIVVFSIMRAGVRYGLYNLAYEEIESYFRPHETDQYGGFDREPGDPPPEVGEAYMRLFEEILVWHAPKYRREKADAICISFPGVYLRDADAFGLSPLRVSLARKAVEDFEKRYRANLFFVNSAMGRAYAEKKCLDARGNPVDSLAYISIDSGVGAGLVVGGELFTGYANMAGELGHIATNLRGERCYCGNRGCLGNGVDVDSILARVRKAYGEHDMTLTEVAQRYEQGEARAVHIVDGAAEELLFAIRAMTCVTGINSVVIGGGIEQLGDRFMQRLCELSNARLTQPGIGAVKINKTRLNHQSDSLGAVQYYIDKVFLTVQEIEINHAADR